MRRRAAHKSRVSRTDTPLGLKPSGFSVHPRRHSHESPKALSAPEDILGRILIAVQHQSTVGAYVGAQAQRLSNTRTAPAAILGRICRIHRLHSLTGACRLVCEDSKEGGPPGVINAFVETCFAL